MRTRVLVALVLASAAFVTPALALTPLPPPSGYVNDLANVVSPETETALEAELSDFEKSNSNEIAVVTVNSMAGDYIEHYAEELFKQWGIGKKDKDNGVLLLLAIEEHKLRIEVGYGLEGALPDSIAQSIITNDMTPLLKAGDYDAAVTKGVASIMAATKGEYTAEASGSSIPVEDWFWIFVFLPIFVLQWLGAILGRSKSWWAGGIIGALIGGGFWLFFPLALLSGGLVTFILVALGLGFDYLVSSAYTAARARGASPVWWAGGGGFGGGSSSGGGFGGFGGGSSGGGGASGSW